MKRKEKIRIANMIILTLQDMEIDLQDIRHELNRLNEKMEKKSEE